MKRFAMFLGFLAILALLAPLAAQDAKKKDVDKTDKKDAGKSDDKKDPEKKDEKKKVEKFVYGQVLRTKITGLKETNRDFLIEIQERDPVKVANVTKWKFQREQQLAQELFNINRIDPKDVNGRFNAMVNYKKNLYNFNLELAKQNVFSAKNMEIRAHETAKVRSMVPPVEFDDAGFQKKWTAKAIAEVKAKDKSGMPGIFPTDFDAVKQGQIVDIYFPKVAGKKDEKKKKGPDDDPVMDRPSEFLLIVIIGDSK